MSVSVSIGLFVADKVGFDLGFVLGVGEALLFASFNTSEQPRHIAS